jgi:hypothetical protein
MVTINIGMDGNAWETIKKNQQKEERVLSQEEINIIDILRNSDIVNIIRFEVLK